jgi:DNA polymerase I-like protein with 3'-5' exonuclease and polymerase domains
VFSDIKEGDYGRHKKGQLPGQLIGSHSLEAWGYRLGVYKGDFAKTTDWRHWSPEMSAYCKQDVEVTRRLYELVESKTMSMESVHLEHQVAWILSRQERFGFYFDKEKAEQLYADLAIKKAQIGQKLQEIFPPFYVQGKEFTPKADNKRYGYVKGCPMTKVHLKDFNPNSGLHIYWAFKRKYGWKPTEFTEKGQVKVDEGVLKHLARKWPEAELIQEYWTLDKRMQQIQDGDKGWLKHYNPETGRIHGYVNGCGAVTGRMTHSKPNLAQVPSNDHPYGKECRALFTVPERQRSWTERQRSWTAFLLRRDARAKLCAKFTGGRSIWLAGCFSIQRRGL